jgi:hypothetical protein
MLILYFGKQNMSYNEMSYGILQKSKLVFKIFGK